MEEAQVKSFSDVFGCAPLLKDLVAKLAHTEIERIKVDRSRMKMSVMLRSSDIVMESLLSELERQLMLQFPDIKDVRVDVAYESALGRGNDLRARISEIWGNAIAHVGRRHRICSEILKSGDWQIKDGRCVVHVCQNSGFILKSKCIDVQLQSYIENCLKESVDILFIDDLKAQEAVFKDAKLFSDAFASKRNPPPLQNPRPMSRSPQGKSESFQPGRKGKGGGKIKVRINSDLSRMLEKSANARKISDELVRDEDIVFAGEVFYVETRDIKGGRVLVSFDITDGSDSLTAKFFCLSDEYNDIFKDALKPKKRISARGKVQFDEYANEVNVMIKEIGPAPDESTKMDDAPVKRVELHLHTQMSSMDGITSAKDYIKRAIKWGHPAIAITDHGVVQAFPEAMEAAKGSDLKVIYGVEAYLVNDLGAIVRCPGNATLSDEMVVFDLETTGLHKETDRIIEIGAVKVKNGAIIDAFNEFAHVDEPLPKAITDLTGITDDMLKDAQPIEEVLPRFLEFSKGCSLAAHNAQFDIGFAAKAAKDLGRSIESAVLDTLELSRFLYPDLSKHKLNIVAEHLGISLENHHRAVDDASAAAEIFLKCREILISRGASTLADVNMLACGALDVRKQKYYHAVILAKNSAGLKNLYELISKSHIDYFFKRPRIPKSEFAKLREGLIIGTACEAGEFFKAVKDGAPDDYIQELADFYDYFEIQPIGNNMYLLREGQVASVQELRDLNKRIADLADRFNKPLVATCDVHFIDPEDEVFRRIIMAGDGFKDADQQAPLYFRTTAEMLGEFDYLGPEKAYEAVVLNPRMIAGWCEAIKPIPDETFPPQIEGAKEQLIEITTSKAKELYGQELPKIVSDRLERELASIIKNGFAVMYIIAQKLVWKSNEDGYLVGSRGSVGSSFVATMAGITEVNPLPPHYLCPACRYSDFDSPEVKAFSGGSGCDMPQKMCPVCGGQLSGEGHDIPFETFLGFDGDKEPDIDLNFSGEYQAKAHAYTEVLFGEGNVFKAGTIGTLADKTAYGYVKKYAEERSLLMRNAEINRLKTGCTGIKRTTGQHPGGLMILPRGHSIYEFCPVQRPANDMSSNVTTTHFDYHSISGRLLKLDLLGHDVPTIIRMLHDGSKVDPTGVPLNDKRVMSLFTSPQELGVSAEQIGCNTGTLGLPEFGTSFVRQMLLDTKPTTFAELVRISGLSHGTDVWLNNAADLIRDGVASLKEVIPTRDDIMLFLINKGVEKKAAFKIMENVRKGKGLKPEEGDLMRRFGVPEWYIESCKKIKYLFPKGHAVAYVTMTVRIAYFKIHYPYSFYSASFSVKAEDFDYELMCFGIDRARAAMSRITELGKEATAKEKSTQTILELVIEMYARGLKFARLDLYKAKASKFFESPSGLMPPLCSVQGLGASAAQSIVDAREDGEFFTIDDFRKRTKTNKTVVDLLIKNGILDGIPETNQMTLF
ncbi:MAG: PolC-type DNA polymerase III [Clostridiales bacterium]|nr:PolC-type DNA polymerase III [Clostridiales bacterium]